MEIHLTLWDLLFIAVGAALVIEGLLKGALRLAFGLAGLLAGYLYAGWAADYVSAWIPLGSQTARSGVAMVAGFIIILLAFVLAGHLAGKLAKAAGLSCLNRVLGAALGFVLAVYLTGVSVRLADRLSPGLGERMSRGAVVSTLSEWALGLEEMIPRMPLPAPSHKKRPQSTAPEKHKAPEAQPQRGVSI
jgi:membrane protein required for colicin V production